MQETSHFPAPARRWLVPGVLAILAVAGCTSAPPVEPKAAAPTVTSAAPAPSDEAQHQQKFARWVAEFRTSARAAGIDEATLHAAFDGVRFVPRVVSSDRAQPEFTRTVWAYLDSAVSAQRVARGQDKLQQLRPQVDAITARYGVPTEIIFAIWGMESNYGSNVGDIPAIDALATLGFEGRREDWARGQLLAALKILQNGDIARERMIGSWAGAMGQTQFLPSNFLAYAVDADGDGRRDIWGSVPDVVASTANFLARSGWQAGQPWALEVRLPPGFDYARADADVRQPASQWASEGVQSMDGTPLPAFDGTSILLPAGARGPAFLTGANFRTILRYNNSTSYALAVGLLAQKLGGGPGVQAPWPRELQALSNSQVRALQTALNARGFDTGTPDGAMGPATRRGIRQYQQSLGLPADGYPTLELLQRLQ
ncbi:MAG: lytic murein transglycosylase [Comamonas sp.]